MKEDRRIRKSKSALKRALFEQIMKKRFSKITVSEICESADVNRSTFYSNYEDMQALLSDIHNDFFEEMMKHAVKEPTDSLLNYQLTKNTLYGMIEYVEKNRKTIQILFHQGNQEILERDMVNYFISRHCSNTSNKVDSYPFLYHTLAFFSLLSAWVKDDFPCSADHLAQIIIEQAKPLHETILSTKIND